MTSHDRDTRDEFAGKAMAALIASDPELHEPRIRDRRRGESQMTPATLPEIVDDYADAVCIAHTHETREEEAICSLRRQLSEGLAIEREAHNEALAEEVRCANRHMQRVEDYEALVGSIADWLRELSEGKWTDYSAAKAKAAETVKAIDNM